MARIVISFFFALTLVTTSGLVSPAVAATSTVSGSLTCPAGQYVWVTVWTEHARTADFYRNGTFVYRSDSSELHVHNYRVRSVNWKVTSLGNITQQSDYCRLAAVTSIEQ